MNKKRKRRARRAGEQREVARQLEVIRSILRGIPWGFTRGWIGLHVSNQLLDPTRCSRGFATRTVNDAKWIRANYWPSTHLE